MRSRCGRPCRRLRGTPAPPTLSSHGGLGLDESRPGVRTESRNSGPGGSRGVLPILVEFGRGSGAQGGRALPSVMASWSELRVLTLRGEAGRQQRGVPGRHSLVAGTGSSAVRGPDRPCWPGWPCPVSPVPGPRGSLGWLPPSFLRESLAWALSRGGPSWPCGRARPWGDVCPWAGVPAVHKEPAGPGPGETSVPGPVSLPCTRNRPAFPTGHSEHPLPSALRPPPSGSAGPSLCLSTFLPASRPAESTQLPAHLPGARIVGDC